MPGFRTFTQECWGAFSLAGLPRYLPSTLIYWDDVSKEWYI